jgi:hypothetical protein
LSFKIGDTLNPLEQNQLNFTRRHFFSRCATGIGSLALASLLNDGWTRMAAGTDRTHFASKAKRVIFLFMSGGPSQLDLFDPKPKLSELSGQLMPESITKGERVAQLQGKELLCVGSRFKFAKYGRSQVDVSELLPHTTRIVDDITIIRSLRTEAINHDPAVTFFQTGHPLPGRPTMGAWFSYGLGSENQNLPAFVVLVSGIGQGQPLQTRYWESGFLPSVHQGVQFRSQGDPVLYVSNPAGMSDAVRRRILDSIRDVNQAQFEAIGDPEIAARIEQYEMAYRMQSSVPDLMDVSDEAQSTLDLYGPDAQTPGTFAANCLLARRLAERDVRFIQLYHRDWDNHSNLPTDITKVCEQTDRGASALIQDLKQRGMLDDTIVLWSGEFGRSPMAQGTSKADSYGRDHHMKAFTGWIAGGGFKRGALIGTTDDFGFNVVSNEVHVHDLHATILNQMGLDHTRLTYHFQGRDHRLTDVAGEVRRELLA